MDDSLESAPQAPKEGLPCWYSPVRADWTLFSHATPNCLEKIHSLSLFLPSLLLLSSLSLLRCLLSLGFVLCFEAESSR